MKPAFALSLSFDGIALLHRAAGGWRFVGEVSLESPDLGGDLKTLRDKAQKLAPGAMRCKVIIPNDQVKYLTVETGSFTGKARDRMVAAALEGETPYAVADLAFDTSPEGSVTHVAAIARETLDEAEAFAEEHGFGPVSFVAAPGDNSFLGEPFFGRARHCKEKVEPDGVAVVVIGPAVMPTERSEGTAPSFSSRRSRQNAPAYDLSPDDPPAPRIRLSGAVEHPDADDPASLPVEAEVEPTRDAPEPPATVAVEDHPDQDFRDLPEQTAEEEPPRDAEVTAAALAVPDERDDLPAEGFAAFLSRRSRPQRAGPQAARKRPEVGPALPPGPVLPPPRNIQVPLPQRQVPKDEAGRMTVFGARNSEPISTAGRRIGLIVTGSLFLVLAVVALWASLFLEDGIAGLFRGEEQPSEFAIAPAAVPAPVVQSDDPVAAALPAESVTVPLPGDPAESGDRPEEPALTDTDAAVLDALRADTAPEADTATEADTAPDVVSEEPDTVPVEMAMLPEDPLPEGEEEALADGALPDETEAPAGDTAEPASPMTDAARYAATGIWPNAPEVPDTPAIIGIDDLYIASIDRTDLAQDAIALLAPQADQPPGAVQSPAAAGTEFQLDSAGLVEPSREGAVNPDGVRVFSGPPPRRPPARPEVAETAPAPEVSAEQSRLASVRPRLRPGDLPERAERSELGGLTRAELAGVRPKARPESITAAPAAAEPEPPVQDGAASSPVGNGSALAVATSPRPDARPSGFASLVARARPAPQVESNGGGEIDEPEVTTTAAPRIPTSASVARQATLRNAINLSQLNLIGVYGTPSNRRALIRLPSGRYKKVQVGDSVDGGRIVAIGDGELRYQKGGRNLTLKVPSG